MLKLFGAVLVTAACGFCGNYCAREKKREYLSAQGFSELFEYLLLRLPSLELMENILADFHQPYLESVGACALLKEGGPCNKRYLNAIQLFAGDKELYSVLSSVKQGFGCTEYHMQEASLASARDRLAPICEKRRQRYLTEGKCYPRLGLLLGAALSILML